jgi:RNA polymerase sigma-70 factor (ECF subfamily)
LDRIGQTPVMAAYLERREALLRFFAVRLGSPAAAEDLVQEMCLRVAAIDPGTPIDNIPGYLHRLGANLMLDRLRQDRRTAARDAGWQETRSLRIGEDEVVDEPSAEAATIARQRLALIVRALEEVSPRTREAFRLHKFDGLSHSEVAERLGISRSAVEKHVSAALKHLMARVGR